MTMNNVAEMLSKNALFCDLTPAELSTLTSNMGKMEVKGKQTVCHQGEKGERFYVLVNGLLKVIANTEDGQEVVLSILGPGMTFGELAVLDGKPRSASIVASIASSLVYIDRHVFSEFLMAHPGVRDKIIVALCGRIRALTERVEDLSAQEIPVRLARAILALSQTLGSTVAGRPYLHVKVSQTDLGNMIGASRESVNKFMRAWEDLGVIEMVDGRVQIVQPERLAKFI